MKANKFLLICGFLTYFALWCPQPSLLFMKEFGKRVINGQAKLTTTLIHSPSRMNTFPIIIPRCIKEMLNLNSKTLI
jgi:hypothetical protein